MANSLLTISQITNEALMVLENSLVVGDCVTRDYDDQFAVSGAKIGSVVNVRKPARFIGTTGPALAVEDLVESSVPIALNTQFHVDTQFSTQDLALSMDLFSQRVLKPMMAAVSNKIDRDVCVSIKNNTANIVGVAGTAPTGLLTYLNAGAYLDAEGAPRDGQRNVIVEQFTSAAIVDSLKGVFVPMKTIENQFKKGLMGTDSGGMDWRLDQNIANQTFGAWATTAGTLTANTSVNAGFVTSGWASTSTITLTNSQTIALNQGDSFAIAGVYGVNPQNRQSYGKLRNFVVVAAAGAAAGTFSVTVSPAIITAGQFQNVTITTASATATVTPFSIAGTTATAVTGAQNVLLHKSAYALACADLVLPEGVVFAGRASDKGNGLSLRVVRQYTINNDAIPTRVDCLYGVAPLYPELACRISS